MTDLLVAQEVAEVKAEARKELAIEALVKEEVLAEQAKDQALEDMLDEHAEEPLEAPAVFVDGTIGSDLEEEPKAKASAEVMTPVAGSIHSFDQFPIWSKESSPPDSLDAMASVDSPPLDSIDEESENDVPSIDPLSPEGTAEAHDPESLESPSELQDDLIENLVFGPGGVKNKRPDVEAEAELIKKNWELKGDRKLMRARMGLDDDSDESDLDEGFVDGDADIVYDDSIEDASPPISPFESPVPSQQSSIEDDRFLPQDTDRRVFDDTSAGARILRAFGFSVDKTGEGVGALPADDLLKAAVMVVQDPRGRDDLQSVQGDIDRLQEAAEEDGKKFSANNQFMLELVKATLNVAKSEQSTALNADDISRRILKKIDHTSDGASADQPAESTA